MPPRHKFLSTALPIGALLLSFPALAEPMPPLTVVGDADLPQDIMPTKMAVIGGRHNAKSVHEAKRVRGEHLAFLTRDGLAQVWQAAATSPATARPARLCAPQTVHWQRSCADMGYPESYSGSVQGVSEIDCGAQLRHEQWLTNSCAPVVAQAPAAAVVAVAQPVAAPTLAAQAAAPVSKDIEAPKAAVAEAVQAVVPQPVPVPEVSKPAAVAGLCGAAVSLMHSSKPDSGWCASGTVAEIVGNGPWQWRCDGSSGGASATCFAPVDFAALAAHQAQEAAPAPAVTAAPSLPPVQETKAPDSMVVPKPQLALTTPQLVTPTLPTTTAVVTTQSAPLATAALATPRLDLALRSNRVEAGATDYAPAAPIRSGAALYPASTGGMAVVPPELATLAFPAGKDAPEESALAQLEALGQKLAANRLARVTVTAYAGMTDGVDARAARKLSLARAMVVRDALMMGGATNDQIRMRALGANTATGASERVDLTDN